MTNDNKPVDLDALDAVHGAATKGPAPTNNPNIKAAATRWELHQIDGPFGFLVVEVKDEGGGPYLIMTGEGEWAFDDEMAIDVFALRLKAILRQAEAQQ